MKRASKRAKTTTTTCKTKTCDAANPQADAASDTSPSFATFVSFNPGPSLECIPDDVFREILACLPTLKEVHVLFQCRKETPVVPSDALVRTPTLRALSQTSRILRSRCLGMAWQRVELCGASLPAHRVTFYKAIVAATRNATNVLNACPHLLPLIRTVSVCFTRYQSAEVIPGFAACLATLPNLTSIQVIHAHSQMTTAIKKGFEGHQFPSVRRISLPSCAHEITRCCPNVEEVICIEGFGSTIIGSLVKGKCHQVRVLKGTFAPIKRLIKLLPNLRYICVRDNWDIKEVAGFPMLDTIEIDVSSDRLDVPLSELVPSVVEVASKLLKENKSQAEKKIILTRWWNLPFFSYHSIFFVPPNLHQGVQSNEEEPYMTREVIKV